MFLPKLYSRTSLGQLAEWQIEVVNDSYRTHEGIVGGKITTSAFTKCESKNVGKKNETSAEQQAVKEASSKHKKKIDSNYFENIDDVDSSVMFEPMLAHKWSDYGSTVKYPVYSQPKLDGMRCIITKDGMFSRNGKKIISAPHLKEKLDEVFKSKPNLVFDGEIYNHDLKHNFNKIISLAKKLKPSDQDLVESKQLLKYWVYDIYDNDLPKLNFEDRFSMLCGIVESLPNNESIVVTQTHLVDSEDSLDKLYEEWLDSGFEGQMVRKNSFYENKRTKSLLKRKTFIDEEFEIVDILDGKGNRSGLATKVIFNNPSGTDTFEAGVIGNESYAGELLKNKSKFIGKKATVVYQNLTPDGSPRFGKMKIIRDYE